MFKHTALCMALFAPLFAHASNDEDLRAIREQIRQLKENYEQHISQLEQRLQQAEANSRNAGSTAAQAQAAAQQTSSEDAFNPAVSLILSGTYGQLQQVQAPATGFAMSPNNTGHTRGFSLKESELGIAANIDPQFRGVATLSLNPAGGVTVENGFVQATALGNGLNLKFGRYFSGLGYLNEQHAHAWDFVDQPLVYRTLWDNQLGEDGVQLKWLAPTDTFVELGAELGRGRGFPGSDRQKNGAGAGVLFAHVGDDAGVSSSWRAGVSLHQTRRENAVSSNVPDLHGTVGGVSNSFSGDSRTSGLDFVWKYAPDGNATMTNFKLHWRVGLRYDQLDPGTAQVGALNALNVVSSYGYQPARNTLMLDFSPSEFSRLRVQAAQDKSRQGLADNQLFLQYIMSLGAHGAHQF